MAEIRGVHGPGVTPCDKLEATEVTKREPMNSGTPGVGSQYRLEGILQHLARFAGHPPTCPGFRSWMAVGAEVPVPHEPTILNKEKFIFDTLGYSNKNS